MATDKKISELPGVVSIVDADLFTTVRESDPTGTKNKKNTGAQVKDFIQNIIPLVKNETLAISPDGQTVFTLAEAPTTPETTLLTLNGQAREYITDFTISGTTLTWNDPGGLTLKTTDTLLVWYNITLTPITSRPVFVARTTGIKTDVTGDGTSYPVIFDTESEDIGGIYDHTTGIFTAPRDASYHFETVLYLGGISVTHTSLSIQLLTTLQGPFLVWIDPTAITYGASNEIIVNGSLTIPMLTGNTAQIVVTVSSADVSKTIDVLASSYFTGYLVT